MALLAEAYGKVGQPEKGLDVLAEGLGLVQQSGERWWEAELLRLRGDLMLAQSRVPSLGSRVAHPLPPTPYTQVEEEQAEACFRQALTTARRQGAKALELRAAMSLGRLWHRRGRSPQACRLVTGIYGQFTEGFDTADLVEARVLLSELTAEEASA